jgi:hypothetical protein
MGFSRATTLAELFHAALTAASSIPKCHSVLEVNYEHQTSGQTLGQDLFIYNEFSLKNDLSFFLQYWNQFGVFSLLVFLSLLFSILSLFSSCLKATTGNRRVDLGEMEVPILSVC